MNSPPRIGILGGTFDPPHVGHLLLGQTAHEQLQLEQVRFLPAGQPPHKEEGPVATVQARITMTRLAIATNPAFTVDKIDAERPAPHYTVTLLPLLQQAFPEHEIWLLIGGDSLRDLASWHEPQAIVDRIRLAVLPRPGATVAWAELEEAVPGVRDAVTLLDGPSVDVSSTTIRRWAAGGRSLRYLVPRPVRNFIARRRLYDALATSDR